MAKALVLTAAGINCDEELADAFELAGAESEFVHLNTLIDRPELVDDYQLIGIPGGFSYGDAVAAGRIMAQLMRQHLYAPLVRAIERGVPIFAPCNGFQIAAQMGLLPGPRPGEPWADNAPTPNVTLADNQSARFEDRWTRVRVPDDTVCIWTQALRTDPETSVLPSAHGEGRFIAGDDELYDDLRDRGQVALMYADGDNFNGSARSIAGICDPSGLMFGLMPHPERFTHWTQHPFWTRLDAASTNNEPMGLQMFRNAVNHANSLVTA